MIFSHIQIDGIFNILLLLLFFFFFKLSMDLSVTALVEMSVLLNVYFEDYPIQIQILHVIKYSNQNSELKK